jgi:thioredoxin 1
MLSRRLFMGVSVLLSLSASGVARASSVVTFSDSAFKVAKASGKPVVIEFHAEWCPTCRAQAPMLRSLAGENFAILTVNYDGQKDIVKQFGVRRQSTLIVFKNGEEVGRAVGITSESAIADLLAKAG